MYMVFSAPMFHLSCWMGVRGGVVDAVWCGGVRCGGAVASVCPSSGQTHHTSIRTAVVPLTTHDKMFVFIRVHVHVHEFWDFWIF